MTTDISPVEPRNSRATLPANTVFELLLDEQRRDALYYLSQKVGAVAIDDLTAQLAHGDGEPTRERLEAVAAGFHHKHLPKLVDTAVVRYDPDARTIERRAAAAALDPYLELSQRHA
ncbi:DUF7344 domain-containing protein [Halosolutus gelatinilyticus]|uniref:DUF7344 domain-containing protein n=1 Tax=Halosolutus gelatinilyticus TaxID=2931975 RepID=UPI001FF12D68|nr:hypothetical protein [Halosolutus gelatinilyticus]